MTKYTYLNITNRVETNPEYNVSLCNNGGAYSKPDITLSGKISGQPATIVIHDDSQGEFGTRFGTEIVVAGKKYEYGYDDIGKAESPDEYSDVPQSLADEIRRAYKEINFRYWILSEPEVYEKN